jgi:hypothetical protein
MYGMFLGIPHLEMADWRGIYILPSIIAIGQKNWLFLSTGAPDRPVPTGHVRCPGHASRPLRSVSLDPTISELSDTHQTVWRYNAPESLVEGLSAQTVWSHTGRAGQKTRGSITRSTRLISGSTRLGSFKMSYELSQYFSSVLNESNSSWLASYSRA